MKNFRTFFISAFLTFAIQEAYAAQGFFIGADILRSKANHVYSAEPGIPSRPGRVYSVRRNGAKAENEDWGGSINAGFRVDIDKIYVAPEIFYDYLGNSSPDFFVNTITSDLSNVPDKDDTIDINQRYGTKLNLGFNIIDGFNIFVNVGVTNTQYDVHWVSRNRSRGGSKLAPIFGGGFSYDINYNLMLKLGYDYQSFTIPYVVNGLSSDVTLQTVRVGMVYSF